MRVFTIATIVILAVVFRFFQLGNLPPSPYWEEVALGYDAYSILKTGKDHHGNWLPVVAFESFGDWKPGFYIYTVVPSIFIFGLNTFAIRFPSAVAGLAIVIGSGILANQLFLEKRPSKLPNEKSSHWLPYLVILVAAVEPWGIIFSRAAWEANLATALVLWSIIFVFKQTHSTNKYIPSYLITAAIGTVLAMYTYHAARIAAPMMVGAAFLFTELEQLSVWSKLKTRSKRLRFLLVPTLTFLLLLSPLLINMTSNTVTNRFTTTSIFSDLDVIIQSNQLKELSGNSFLSRIVYHRYLLFGKEIISNFGKHFDLGYLFLHGDTNPRHSVQYFGQLYPLSLVLLIIGLSTLVYRHRRQAVLFIFWFIFGLFASTLVVGSPHAVRSLVVFPFFAIIIGLGLHRSIDWLSRISKPKQLIFTSIFSVIFVAQIGVFWLYYSQVYPAVFAQEWQYGYKEMIATVNQLAIAYPDEQIYITREQGRPAMYYWFYSQIDPTLVQSYELTSSKDQSEFLQFGRFHFIDSADAVSTSYGILAASPSFTADVGLATEGDVAIVSNLLGKPIWIIQHYEK